ncbi:protein NLRC3-like isoform X3 [Halichondria panicea]
MLQFVRSIKRKYSERLLISREEQWPPVKRDKLINLQLIETSRADSFGSSTNEEVKKTPIHYGDLFSGRDDKRPVKRVLVEGHAGIGKTTLSLTLSEGWAEGKLLQQFDCVLLLPLRENKVATANCFSDLLKLLHASENVRSAVASELSDNEGEGLLIIANGWDELSEAARSKDSFVYDLLFGSIVPFASVLITSRPSVCSDIRRLPLINRLVAVIGFDKQGVKAYIKAEYEHNMDKYSRLLKQIESNPLLQSICSIPLNCAITCHLWEVLNEELPLTMTGLYTQIILSVVYRDIRKYDVFDMTSLSNFDSIPENLKCTWWKLCEFAFDSICGNQLVFYANELKSFFPDLLVETKMSLFGLLQFSPSLLPVGHELSVSFLHLTFQEYLAAMHILTLPVLRQITLCSVYGSATQFSMVWRFFFGLLSLNDKSRSIANKRTYNHIDIEGMLASLMKSFTSKQNTLLFCHCAFEYQDEHLTSLVALKVNELIHGNFPIAQNALDGAAMFNMIAHTKTCSSLVLRFNGCDLGDDGLQRLTTIFSNACGSLQVKRLYLNKNQLTSTGISELFIRRKAFTILEELCLSKNQIDYRGIHSIFCSSGFMPYPSLRYLRLSHNPLSVAGFEKLENAILADSTPNLYSLDLTNTMTMDPNINGNMVASLMEALSIKCPRLVALYLSMNNLGIPGGAALGEKLPRLTQRVAEFDLFIDDTQLGDNGLDAFISSQSENCHIFSLGIKRNEIHHQGLSLLAEKLHSGTMSCIVLDLVGNPLECEGVFLLSSLLANEHCRTRHLYLSSCQLTTSSSLKEEQSKISLMGNINCQVKSLDLSDNNFSGERVYYLAALMSKCMYSLEILYTSNCHLNSKDLQFLIKILSSDSSKKFVNLGQWYINDNDIDDSGVCTLIESLKLLFPRLTVIDVNGNRISHIMKKRLEECNKMILKVICTELLECEPQNSLSIRVKLLAEWKTTALVPRDKNVRKEFFRMWDDLLALMCWQLEDMVDVPSIDTTSVQNELTLSLSTMDSTTTCTSQQNQEAVDTSANTAQVMPTPKIVLNARDHLREAKTALWDVRAKWRSFGLELGVDPYTLDSIAVKYQNNPDECLPQLLQHWMDSDKTDPTWERVVYALRARPVGFTQLAQTLKNKYNLDLP